MNWEASSRIASPCDEMVPVLTRPPRTVLPPLTRTPVAEPVIAPPEFRMLLPRVLAFSSAMPAAESEPSRIKTPERMSTWPTLVKLCW